jgi:hypothetical protein
MFTSAQVLAGLAMVSAGSAAAQNIMANPPKFSYGTPSANAPGVKSANKNGATNPSKPSLNTPINQTSVARLASINSIDDWCTFGPMPVPNNQTLGYLEETTVAYCTKPRNNARVIVSSTSHSCIHGSFH